MTTSLPNVWLMKQSFDFLMLIFQQIIPVLSQDCYKHMKGNVFNSVKHVFHQSECFSVSARGCA